MEFSVVIPTFERPEYLRELLKALSKQSLDGAFEVIVVNDGGEPLGPIVQPFQDSLLLKLLRQPNGGPAKARNLGAHSASGRWLVFVDDDCVPTETWLDKMLEACHSRPSCAIGGRVVNLLSHNAYAEASQLLVDFLYEYYQDGRRGRFFTTNNLAVPKERFWEVGGFDEGFSGAAAEDREFCDRWSYCGNDLFYEPGIVVGHAHGLTLAGFLGQHFGYGCGARRYWKLRRERSGDGAMFEPGKFYAGLLSYPTRRYGRSARGFRTTLLFALAQLANAAGYFLGKRVDS